MLLDANKTIKITSAVLTALYQCNQKTCAQQLWGNGVKSNCPKCDNLSNITPI